MPEALELDIGSLRLSALAWGRPTGRPVLATHGWLDNAATMAGLAPLLCEALDLRIVSLDLPGHGLSEPRPGPYHFIDWVPDVLAAAAALGWQRYSLLGHSMGAGISVLLAGTMPEQIERCVLLEGIGPLTEDAEQAPRRLARALRVEQRKRDKQKRLFSGPEEAIERLCEAAQMKPSSARTLIDRGLVELEGGWTWRADPRLRNDSRLRLSEAHVLAFLRQLRCPVMLVHAEHGWPHDAAAMRARMDAIASLELVSVPGHHHVHLDEPELVAPHVIRFLAQPCESP